MHTHILLPQTCMTGTLLLRYWLMCAGDEMIASTTSIVGSIGARLAALQRGARLPECLFRRWSRLRPLAQHAGNQQSLSSLRFPSRCICCLRQA